MSIDEQMEANDKEIKVVSHHSIPRYETVDSVPLENNDINSKHRRLKR